MGNTSHNSNWARRGILRSVAIVLLMMTWTGCATAQKTFGDWHSDTSDPNANWALTVNDSGQGFGQFCDLAERMCYYVLAFDQTCEKGSTYPILVATDLEAVHQELLCDGPGENKYRYFLRDFTKMDDLVRQSARIGFAVALQQDQFLVIRFRLNGAVKAIDSMRAGADRRAPSKRNTRDQKL